MTNNQDSEFEPLVLTVAQVAALLQRKERTVTEMCYRKRIPHYKLGRAIRFKKEEILAWLEESCKVDVKPNDDTSSDGNDQQ